MPTARVEAERNIDLAHHDHDRQAQGQEAWNDELAGRIGDLVEIEIIGRQRG